MATLVPSLVITMYNNYLQQGELRKGDKLLAINDECVENMPLQDVVKKLRLLNEEATNSITLCIMREEVCINLSRITRCMFSS